MGAETPEAILIAAGFHIYTAPVGTPIPVDIDAALDGDFTDVGYTTDDGAVFTHTPTVNPITMHQSFQPVRYVVASVEDTLSFVLGQWDEDTIPLAFGGGEWTATANGWMFEPVDRAPSTSAASSRTPWTAMSTGGSACPASCSRGRRPRRSRSPVPPGSPAPSARWRSVPVRSPGRCSPTRRT